MCPGFALAEGTAAVPAPEKHTGGVTRTAADRILYGGKIRKPARLRDWPQFGYYQALAVLTDEQSGSG